MPSRFPLPVDKPSAAAASACHPLHAAPIESITCHEPVVRLSGDESGNTLSRPRRVSNLSFSSVEREERTVCSATYIAPLIYFARRRKMADQTIFNRRAIRWMARFIERLPSPHGRELHKLGPFVTKVVAYRLQTGAEGQAAGWSPRFAPPSIDEGKRRGLRPWVRALIEAKVSVSERNYRSMPEQSVALAAQERHQLKSSTFRPVLHHDMMAGAIVEIGPSLRDRPAPGT
jgi:hypothetical protein